MKLAIAVALLVCWTIIVGVVGSPVRSRNSPIIFVEVMSPESPRTTRNIDSTYGSKTTGGVSFAKTDFNKKARGARVHVADGAYPVYYTPGMANGRFGAKIFTLT